MLAIRIELLTGRYNATAYNRRDRAEWPPHPARLFATLMAAYFDAPVPDEAGLKALLWLEAQESAEISASINVNARSVHTVFVPVNDVSVVKPPLAAENKLEAAQAALEQACVSGKPTAAAEKKLGAASAALKEAYVQACMATESPSKEENENAKAWLPEARVKQPRFFPSVAPEEPRIIFAWPRAECDSNIRSALAALLKRVTRLGHSSSMVHASLVDIAAWQPTWVPMKPTDSQHLRALTLRVTSSGHFVATDTAFKIRADAPGPRGPVVLRGYKRFRPQRRQPVFSSDMIVLGCAEGQRFPSHRGVDIARCLRKAVLSVCGEDAPETITGHSAPGKPSSSVHLAYVPLPYVHSEYADGQILGVALVLPANSSAQDRQQLLMILARLEALGSNANDEENGIIRLWMGRTGAMSLRRVDGTPHLRTLDASTWVRRSRTWSTATPIALDRHPGSLFGRNTAEHDAAYDKACDGIALACERLNLPVPESIELRNTPWISGASPVKQFATFGSGGNKRALTHARITFPASAWVQGPLLLGAGRYFGLGLCRPAAGENDA